MPGPPPQQAKELAVVMMRDSRATPQQCIVSAAHQQHIQDWHALACTCSVHAGVLALRHGGMTAAEAPADLCLMHVCPAMQAHES